MTSPAPAHSPFAYRYPPLAVLTPYLILLDRIA